METRQGKLKINNNLSGQKELFLPINEGFVGLYVCGPTVYSNVHLGNCRTFASFDLVYRYLLHLGYKVRYVRNITDVGHLESDADTGEDKISKKARLEKLEPMEIVQQYTLDFRNVTRLFNMLPPSIEPTATGHLIEQIEMIEEIIKNGYAYEVNGSVYFDVPKYSEKFNYGELSGRKLDELMSGSRDLDGQEEKRSPLDFALWKNASAEHIMKWSSPWGIGFPGWHLECSAMSTKYLGEQFDIHGGGMDLKFPHHECEIAQGCASTGKSPVRYWMHGNMLTLNGKKMSKSTGNSILPMELFTGNNEIMKEAFDPSVVRFFMMQAHYSSTLDFTEVALKAAEKGYLRMVEAIEASDKLKPSADSNVNVYDLVDKFYQAMDDDFNAPILIAHLFDGVKILNGIKNETVQLNEKDLNFFTHEIKAFFYDVLGMQKREILETKDERMDPVMQLIMELRAQARENKDWTTSDQIRNGLIKAGIVIKDTKEGASWE